METHLRSSTVLPFVAILILHTAQAGPVSDWHTFKAAPPTVLSGQGTSNPVWGSLEATAQASFLVGYFEAMSLTNIGDRVTFNYQVTFTDAAGMASNDDQFRFALYDLNGQPRVTEDNTATAGVAGYTDDWRGYWFGVDSTQATAAPGTIRKRISGNLHPLANAGTILLGRPAGEPVLFTSSTGPEGGPSYFAEMAIERTPAGLAVAGYFGGNGATNIFAINDDEFPQPVNFGAVAFLNGGNNSCDQLNLQSVTVTYSVSNALEIVTHPMDAEVTAGESAGFSASWSGSGLIPGIQWFENGSEIFGATNATYTIEAATLDQDGNKYTVTVSNVFGDGVTSSEATLQVIADTVPPRVLSVASLLPFGINVIFSKPVDPLTAQDGSSYTLPGTSISFVTLITETNALLTLDDPIETDEFILTVRNVQDLSGNSVAATNVTGVAHGFDDSVSVLIDDGLAFGFNEKVVVHAGGSDIFGTADQFHYVYETVSGDFDLAVRIESLLDTDPNAKAGLMVRINTFFDSPNVMIEATPARFIFQYRSETGGTSTAVGAPRPPTDFPNCWVRLVREGSVISGYASTSAGEWILLGNLDTATSAEGEYPAAVLVGLAVTSHNVNQVTQAVFSEFGLVSEMPVLTVSQVGSDVELTWPASALGFTLQTTPSLTSPLWNDIPGSSATTQMSLPIGSGALFFRLSK